MKLNFKNCDVAIHIGKEIRRVLEQKGITGAWLAEKIKTSQRNLYALLNRKEISTSQLEQISEALEYDFFRLYSKEEFSEVQEPSSHYVPVKKKKNVLITIELDGDEKNLKEWIKRLTSINQLL